MNGQLWYLLRAVHHESEVLESVVAAKCATRPGVEASQAQHEDTWPTTELRRAALKETGDRGWPGGPSTVNNHGESAAVVSETRTRLAAIYTPEDAPKIQLTTPSVRIDFNQVAVSSLAKRASVLAEQRALTV